MSHAGVTEEFTIVLLLVAIRLKKVNGIQTNHEKTRNIKIEILHQDRQDYDVYHNSVDEQG